jgi:hypothetical protein
MDVVFAIDATGSMANTITAAHDKAVDLAFELHTKNRSANFTYGCVCYRDPVDEATDQHEMFDLAPNSEDLATWLGDIKATGGGDDPEDFVGCLELIHNRISWRPGSKRAVIWIADAPAHGKLYCGRENHQEEEPKLEPLIAKLAKDGVYCVAISLSDYADPCFARMRDIYQANGGPHFAIESFRPEPGQEVDRIAETMMTTTSAVVSSALGGMLG